MTCLPCLAACLPAHAVLAGMCCVVCMAKESPKSLAAKACCHCNFCCACGQIAHGPGAHSGGSFVPCTFPGACISSQKPAGDGLCMMIIYWTRGSQACGPSIHLVLLHLGHALQAGKHPGQDLQGFSWSSTKHPVLQARDAGGTLKVEISKQDVLDRVAELLKSQDLSKYVL